MLVKKRQGDREGLIFAGLIFAKGSFLQQVVTRKLVISCAPGRKFLWLKRVTNDV